MSASPIARQACSHAQAIPSRKVLLTDPSQMPDVYSSTPGGTLYSTTPGGKYHHHRHPVLLLVLRPQVIHVPVPVLSKEFNYCVVVFE